MATFAAESKSALPCISGSMFSLKSLSSFVIGVATTIGTCYANGVNPLSGQIMWPKNNGFEGIPEYEILKPGTLIDRYGSDDGFFAAPQGMTFGERSLPPNYVNKEFNTYKW